MVEGLRQPSEKRAPLLQVHIIRSGSGYALTALRREARRRHQGPRGALETVTAEEAFETMETLPRICGLFFDQTSLANDVSSSLGFTGLHRVFTNDLEQLALRGARNLLDPD